MMKVLLLSAMVFAAREHGSHVYGAGKVSLAFDGKSGKIQMEVPAEAILGFEHQAKSKQDKQKKDKALTKLEEKISEMIVLDPSLKCEIKKDIFEVNQEDSHADIEAEFNVTCAAPVAGSTISFNFTKHFSRLKKVQVDVLADGVQKSTQVLKNGDSVELK
ncbi:hypothetical protein AZI85_03845 [Bdellovibrio bacteriovorus]|uniref:Uncharacterized protein n=1 Tax=Bdellovibrio bacteriovorus TaxID=959 RepID=A0A150WKY7_BDEBC|nr:DUF2796 domain-containing protein [Bdellovibrio bacteriovorus]KYG64552.1 hypothetical protein AZI85_03845 [Bdellovibrio bacteriovorus]